MMLDVGYKNVHVTNVAQSRAMAVGKRIKHQDMLRAGLSVKNVR